ncbi:MAG: hypothetical protein IKD28_03890 [Clostridia bacterium]|nr:hypothetical protein [Clostridia bacterium]
MKKKKLILLIVGAVLLLAVIGTLLYIFLSVLPAERERREREEAIRAYYEAKLEQYRAENERYADYEVDVAFLGDSLTDGYDVAAYYPQYVVSNRGIGGETTYGLEARLQVSVYDLKPKVAVLLIGVNNLGTMMDNYEDIIKGLKENLPDTKIVVLSLTPMGNALADKNNVATYTNVYLKMLAARHECRFVDLYSALLNPDTGEIYAEYTTDGLHLSPRGYEVMTAAITPTLQQLLGK